MSPAGQLGWHTPVLMSVTPPVMVANAAMGAPSLIVAIAMLPPAMHAVAVIAQPTVSMSTLVAVPISQATAAMLAPAVNVAVVTAVAPPVMPATTTLLTPTVVAGVSRTVAAPLLSATAAVLTPTVTVQNAVNFDTVSAGNTVSGTTHSCTITTNAGDYVTAEICTNAGSSTVSSITCGGVAMTPLATVPYNNSAANGNLTMYGLAGVSAGTQTVTATISASLVAQITAAAYKNVVSVGSVTTAFGSSTTPSQSATCSPGQMIVATQASAGGGSGAYTPSGGTNRYNTHAIASPGLVVSDATTNTTFTTTMGVTATWGSICAVLSPT